MELLISVVTLGFFATVIAVLAMFFGHKQVASKATDILAGLNQSTSKEE